MSREARNWRADAATQYVYEPDERFEVRLCEQAITLSEAGRQWSVRLYRNDTLRHTIATDVPRQSTARNEMITWLKEYPRIVSE